jgi:hypothetical protein
MTIFGLPEVAVCARERAIGVADSAAALPSRIRRDRLMWQFSRGRTIRRWRYVGEREAQVVKG